jgi:tetratricopeptide (TPR) repeat protein
VAAPAKAKKAPAHPSPIVTGTLGGRPLHGDATRLTAEGTEQLKARHFPEAVKAFEAAAKADPKHPVVWNNLGTAYLSIEKQSKALSSFKKAIDIDPNYALAHYNIGAVKDAVLDYDGAMVSYARAIELDPMLMDPAVNPPVVNNTHLAAIQLLLYGQQVGARGGKVTPVDEPPTKKSKPAPQPKPTPPPPPPLLPTPGR